MMLSLSIVILTKNEELNLARCLKSVQGFANEILVVDNGSSDNTIAIAKSYNTKVLQTEWKGYAATKNLGNNQATYSWILSIDADEELSDELKQSIRHRMQQQFDSTKAFAIQRKMVYCNKIMHYGALSKEYRIRLFNRDMAFWNQNKVHEELTFKQAVQIEKLEGVLWHHSYQTVHEHRERLEKYAQLSADQMMQENRKATFIKKYTSPLFSFIKNFFFKGGFLDGHLGYLYAKNEMWYVQRKYQLLAAINQLGP